MQSTSCSRRFGRRLATIPLGVAMLLFSAQAMAATEFNPAACNQVSGTLNIHWEALAGPSAPCTGIEFTNGTLADASDGTATFQGTGVSNNTCIGIAAYTFTLSTDKLTLTGADTAFNVPMVLTRAPTEACFVGHWISGPNDYRAHISAAAFNAPVAVPVFSPATLILLGVALASIGFTVLRRI